jgi:hypothetical protein
MINLGTVPAGTTLYIPFATYGGTEGESITCTGLAVTDIEIYKDGSVTQRASDAGYALLDTDGIDFDGITGIHGFSIDLNDNTTAGFFAVGSWYWVVVSAITVDAQTVNFIAAIFRIGPAETVAGYSKVDTSHFAGTAITSASGIPEVKVASLTAGAIVNATFAADVGSTAYATNIIALAVRKVLDELNIDHLMKVPVADNANMTTEVPDGTVLSNLMTATGDTSDFTPATDSLEGLIDTAQTIGVKIGVAGIDTASYDEADLISGGLLKVAP